MKRISLIVLWGLLFLSLTFNLAQAVDQPWCSELPVEKRSGGIVPCGRSCDDPTTSDDETEPCTLCHFFVMIDKIIDFLLLRIVPALATLMIAIGGFMYIIAYAGGAEGGPAMLSRAKKLFTSVVFGLLIIYGAFLVVGMFLWLIGLADWTTDIYRSWWETGLFEINCD